MDALCERHGLYRKLPVNPKASVITFTDSSGNTFYSVNVVVGVDDDLLVQETIGLFPYAALNAYNQQRAGQGAGG